MTGGNGVWRYLYNANSWVRISDYHGAAKIAVDAAGNPYTCDANNLAWRWDSKNQKFVQLPGGCIDIAVGPEGTIWSVSTRQSMSTGNYMRYYDFKSASWIDIYGAAIRIAAGPKGVPIHVNNNNEIYLWAGTAGQWQGQTWTRMPGAAIDVGYGADGSLWITGTDQGVYRYIAAKNVWVQIDGAATQISVDQYGQPWVTNSGNGIFRRLDQCSSGLKYPADASPKDTPVAPKYTDAPTPCAWSSWEQTTGAIMDIAVGPEGNVWAIGSNQGIYTWDETAFTWRQINGAGVRIAVGPQNTAWHVNQGGNVYYYLGNNNWKQVDLNGARAQDIGVGADGSAWATDSDNGIWKYEGNGGWVKYPGGATRISVDSKGNAWIVGGGGVVYRWADNTWVQMPGAGYDIGVGANDVMWVVGMNRVPFKWSHATGGYTQSNIPSTNSIAVGPDGRAWVATTDNKCFRQSGEKWKQLSGAAVDIGAGADGSVFVVGLKQVPNGGAIYRWQYKSATFVQISDLHGGVRVDVDPKGNPWIVDNKNALYAWDASKQQFILQSQLANDVAVGPDGSVWIVSNTATGPGWLLRYINNKGDWQDASGTAAIRVAIGPKGVSYHVNQDNNIYKWNGGNSYTQLPGKALDIGVGADGSIWIAGTDQGIYRFIDASNAWVQIDGAATQITVDACGNPWVANSGNGIFQRIDDCQACGSTPDDVQWNEVSNTPFIPDADANSVPKNWWELVTGGAMDISVGPEGNTWIIGTDQGIYYWTEKTSSWTRVGGAGVRIAVGPNNTPYHVNSGNNIYKWNGNGGWNQLSGAAIDIGVGADGSVFIIGTDNAVYNYNAPNNQWVKWGGNGIRVSVDKYGRPWTVSSNGQISRYQNGAWKTLSGAGLDIGIGHDNTPYVVGTDRNIYKYTYSSSSWSNIGNTGSSNVAAGPDGVAWTTDTSGAIERQSSEHWVDLQGGAIDIGVGTDGTVHVVGQDKVAGGSGVYRWQHGAKSFVKISDYHGAVRIATDGSGNAWIVDESNLIWTWDKANSVFVKFPGAATDIAVGADGSIWCIGIQSVGGGYNIRYFDKTKQSWVTISGGAVRISVLPNGNPWVVNNGNSIFRWNGNGWEGMPGAAKDIGIAADGTVYIVGTDGNVYRWIEATRQWYKTTTRGGAAQISADAYGNSWTVDSVGTIRGLYDDALTYNWPVDDSS